MFFPGGGRSPIMPSTVGLEDLSHFHLRLPTAPTQLLPPHLIQVEGTLTVLFSF